MLLLSSKAPFLNMPCLRHHVEEKHTCRQKQRWWSWDRGPSRELSWASPNPTETGTWAWALGRAISNSAQFSTPHFSLPNCLTCNHLTWCHPILDTHLLCMSNLAENQITVHPGCPKPLVMPYHFWALCTWGLHVENKFSIILNELCLLMKIWRWRIKFFYFTGIQWYLVPF